MHSVEQRQSAVVGFVLLDRVNLTKSVTVHF